MIKSIFAAGAVSLILAMIPITGVIAAPEAMDTEDMILDGDHNGTILESIPWNDDKGGPEDIISEGALADIREDTIPEGATADIREEIVLEDELINVYEDSWTDSGELFSDYVDVTFNMSATVARSAYKAGERLKTVDKDLYEILSGEIKKIAESGGSTYFTIPIEELGVVDGDINGFLEINGIEFGKSTVDEINETLKWIYDGDIIRVYNTLLADMPYEFYWKDKQYAYRADFGVKSYIPSGDDREIVQSVTELKLPTIQIRVSPNYRQDEDPYVVKSDVSNIKKALARAKNVINKGNKKSGDYNILKYFKDWILNNTSYYYKENDSEYGDPWQLIYVFDGDASTAVTCEGYSKAFKYLCDNAALSDGTECIAVKGKLSGESHMWNIVSLQGERYLVDLTNSDSGMVGDNDELFLAGSKKGDAIKGYTFNVFGMELEYEYARTSEGNKDVTYSQMDIFGADWLTLSDKSYSSGDDEEDESESEEESDSLVKPDKKRKNRDDDDSDSGETGTPAYLITASPDTVKNVIGFTKVRDKAVYVSALNEAQKEDGARFNYSFFQYYTAERAAKAEGPVLIETDKWISFDMTALQAIENCPYDIRVDFMYGGIKRSFIIPGDYKATKLADNNGYAGFLHIIGRVGAYSPTPSAITLP